ncbi:ACGX-repeat peptide [Mitsuokella multacida]|nr:ACGX-repeat peptide [Mitsuokella multacida]
MALKNLAAWNKKTTMVLASPSCGSGDKAIGTACGSGDK